MSTDCNCLLLLSGSGLENVIFSVFPERRKASAFKGIPTNVYVWSTVTRSARGAFLRPHLLIMKQYLILQFKQEEILHCFCFWTPLVMAIHEFPFTHCSCLLLCPWPPLNPPDSGRCGALGLGFSISASSAIFVPQTELIYFSRPELGTASPGKADQRGWHWPLAGHMKGSGVSCPLPWVTMAFETPSYPNPLMREKICCSESVEHVRSAMKWDFLQWTSTAQTQLWGGSSHCLRTPGLLKILWSHISPRTTLRFLFV